ncbi:uncharacterized protein LOC135394684 [Ornithodoros turicata]|uniref:uncharacterized protein LOC135394684 n=1 Tax=Ornithodoros turicata TaxID=34597 RepID=UPI00313A20A7
MATSGSDGKALIDVVVENQVFQAERALLVKYSIFFRECLAQDKNKNKSKLKLSGISAETFNILLNYMKTGHLSITPDNASDIFNAALRLHMSDVVKRCIKMEAEAIPLGEHVLKYSAARRLQLREEEQRAFNYLTANFLSVSTTKEFLDMNVDDLVQLMSAESLGCNCEYEVFEAGMRWLNYNPGVRYKYGDQIMCLVLFHNMNLGELHRCHEDPTVAQMPEVRHRILAAISSWLTNEKWRNDVEMEGPRAKATSDETSSVTRTADVQSSGAGTSDADTSSNPSSLDHPKNAGTGTLIINDPPVGGQRGFRGGNEGDEAGPREASFMSGTRPNNLFMGSSQFISRSGDPRRPPASNANEVADTSGSVIEEMEERRITECRTEEVRTIRRIRRTKSSAKTEIYGDENVWVKRDVGSTLTVRYQGPGLLPEQAVPMPSEEFVRAATSLLERAMSDTRGAARETVQEEIPLVEVTEVSGTRSYESSERRGEIKSVSHVGASYAAEVPSGVPSTVSVGGMRGMSENAEIAVSGPRKLMDIPSPSLFSLPLDGSSSDRLIEQSSGFEGRAPTSEDATAASLESIERLPCSTKGSSLEVEHQQSTGTLVPITFPSFVAHQPVLLFSAVTRERTEEHYIRYHEFQSEHVHAEITSAVPVHGTAYEAVEPRVFGAPQVALPSFIAHQPVYLFPTLTPEKYAEGRLTTVKLATRPLETTPLPSLLAHQPVLLFSVVAQEGTEEQGTAYGMLQTQLAAPEAPSDAPVQAILDGAGHWEGYRSDLTATEPNLFRVSGTTLTSFLAHQPVQLFFVSTPEKYRKKSVPTTVGSPDVAKVSQEAVTTSLGIETKHVPDAKSAVTHATAVPHAIPPPIDMTAELISSSEDGAKSISPELAKQILPSSVAHQVYKEVVAQEVIKEPTALSVAVSEHPSTEATTEQGLGELSERIVPTVSISSSIEHTARLPAEVLELEPALEQRPSLLAHQPLFLFPCETPRISEAKKQAVSPELAGQILPSSVAHQVYKVVAQGVIQEPTAFSVTVSEHPSTEATTEQGLGELSERIVPTVSISSSIEHTARLPAEVLELEPALEQLPSLLAHQPLFLFPCETPRISEAKKQAVSPELAEQILPSSVAHQVYKVVAQGVIQEPTAFSVTVSEHPSTETTTEQGLGELSERIVPTVSISSSIEHAARLPAEVLELEPALEQRPSLLAHQPLFLFSFEAPQTSEVEKQAISPELAEQIWPSSVAHKVYKEVVAMEALQEPVTVSAIVGEHPSIEATTEQGLGEVSERIVPTVSISSSTEQVAQYPVEVLELEPALEQRPSLLAHQPLSPFSFEAPQISEVKKQAISPELAEQIWPSSVAHKVYKEVVAQEVIKEPTALSVTVSEHPSTEATTEQGIGEVSERIVPTVSISSSTEQVAQYPAEVLELEPALEQRPSLLAHQPLFLFSFEAPQISEVKKQAISPELAEQIWPSSVAHKVYKEVVAMETLQEPITLSAIVGEHPSTEATTEQGLREVSERIVPTVSIRSSIEQVAQLPAEVVEPEPALEQRPSLLAHQPLFLFSCATPQISEAKKQVVSSELAEQIWPSSVAHKVYKEVSMEALQEPTALSAIVGEHPSKEATTVQGPGELSEGIVPTVSISSSIEQVARLPAEVLELEPALEQRPSLLAHQPLFLFSFEAPQISEVKKQAISPELAEQIWPSSVAHKVYKEVVAMETLQEPITLSAIVGEHPSTEATTEQGLREVSERIVPTVSIRSSIEQVAQLPAEVVEPEPALEQRPSLLAHQPLFLFSCATPQISEAKKQVVSSELAEQIWPSSVAHKVYKEVSMEALQEPTALSAIVGEHPSKEATTVQGPGELSEGIVPTVSISSSIEQVARLPAEVLELEPALEQRPSLLAHQPLFLFSFEAPQISEVKKQAISPELAEQIWPSSVAHKVYKEVVAMETLQEPITLSAIVGEHPSTEATTEQGLREVSERIVPTVSIRSSIEQVAQLPAEVVEPEPALEQRPSLLAHQPLFLFSCATPQISEAKKQVVSSELAEQIWPSSVAHKVYKEVSMEALQEPTALSAIVGEHPSKEATTVQGPGELSEGIVPTVSISSSIEQVARLPAEVLELEPALEQRPSLLAHQPLFLFPCATPQISEAKKQAVSPELAEHIWPSSVAHQVYKVVAREVLQEPTVLSATVSEHPPADAADEAAEQGLGEHLERIVPTVSISSSTEQVAQFPAEVLVPERTLEQLPSLLAHEPLFLFPREALQISDHKVSLESTEANRTFEMPVALKVSKEVLGKPEEATAVTISSSDHLLAPFIDGSGVFQPARGILPSRVAHQPVMLFDYKPQIHSEARPISSSAQQIVPSIIAEEQEFGQVQKVQPSLLAHRPVMIFCESAYATSAKDLRTAPPEEPALEKRHDSTASVSNVGYVVPYTTDEAYHEHALPSLLAHQPLLLFSRKILQVAAPPLDRREPDSPKSTPTVSDWHEQDSGSLPTSPEETPAITFDRYDTDDGRPSALAAITEEQHMPAIAFDRPALATAEGLGADQIDAHNLSLVAHTPVMLFHYESPRVQEKPSGSADLLTAEGVIAFPGGFSSEVHALDKEEEPPQIAQEQKEGLLPLTELMTEVPALAYSPQPPASPLSNEVPPKTDGIISEMATSELRPPFMVEKSASEEIHPTLLAQQSVTLFPHAAFQPKGTLPDLSEPLSTEGPGETGERTIEAEPHTALPQLTAEASSMSEILDTRGPSSASQLPREIVSVKSEGASMPEGWPPRIAGESLSSPGSGSVSDTSTPRVSHVTKTSLAEYRPLFLSSPVPQEGPQSSTSLGGTEEIAAALREYDISDLSRRQHETVSEDGTVPTGVAQTAGGRTSLIGSVTQGVVAAELVSTTVLEWAPPGLPTRRPWEASSKETAPVYDGLTPVKDAIMSDTKSSHALVPYMSEQMCLAPGAPHALHDERSQSSDGRLVDSSGGFEDKRLETGPGTTDVSEVILPQAVVPKQESEELSEKPLPAVVTHVDDTHETSLVPMGEAATDTLQGRLQETQLVSLEPKQRTTEGQGTVPCEAKYEARPVVAESRDESSKLQFPLHFGSDAELPPDASAVKTISPHIVPGELAAEASEPLSSFRQGTLGARSGFLSEAVEEPSTAHVAPTAHPGVVGAEDQAVFHLPAAAPEILKTEIIHPEDLERDVARESLAPKVPFILQRTRIIATTPTHLIEVTEENITRAISKDPEGSSAKKKEDTHPKPTEKNKVTEEIDATSVKESSDADAPDVRGRVVKRKHTRSTGRLRTKSPVVMRTRIFAGDLAHSVEVITEKSALSAKEAMGSTLSIPTVTGKKDDSNANGVSSNQTLQGVSSKQKASTSKRTSSDSSSEEEVNLDAGEFLGAKSDVITKKLSDIKLQRKLLKDAYERETNQKSVADIKQNIDRLDRIEDNLNKVLRLVTTTEPADRDALEDTLKISSVQKATAPVEGPKRTDDVNRENRLQTELDTMTSHSTIRVETTKDPGKDTTRTTHKITVADRRTLSEPSLSLQDPDLPSLGSFPEHAFLVEPPVAPERPKAASYQSETSTWTHVTTRVQEPGARLKEKPKGNAQVKPGSARKECAPSPVIMSSRRVSQLPLKAVQRKIVRRTITRSVSKRKESSFSITCSGLGVERTGASSQSTSTQQVLNEQDIEDIETVLSPLDTEPGIPRMSSAEQAASSKCKKTHPVAIRVTDDYDVDHERSEEPLNLEAPEELPPILKPPHMELSPEKEPSSRKLDFGDSNQVYEVPSAKDDDVDDDAESRPPPLGRMFGRKDSIAVTKLRMMKEHALEDEDDDAESKEDDAGEQDEDTTRPHPTFQAPTVITLSPEISLKEVTSQQDSPHKDDVSTRKDAKR